jgi:outer membrane protein assembly factor BamB
MSVEARALLMCCALCAASCTPKQAAPPKRPLISERPAPLHASWPMSQGGLMRTGHRDVEPILKPRIAWRARVGVQSWLNTPLLVGDMVITGSSGAQWNASDSQDGVVAMSVADGKRRWFAPASADVNGIAYGAGLVVAVGDEGAAWTLDAKSGAVRWRSKSRVGAKMYATPLIIGQLVVVADAAGILYGYHLMTGERLWELSLNEPIRDGLASDGESIYVATMGGSVVALTTGGAITWRVKLSYDPSTGQARADGSGSPAAFWSAPTVDGPQLILGFVRDTTYSHPAILALRREDGELIWRADSVHMPQVQWGNLRSSPTLLNDRLYWAEPYSRDLAALTRADGKLQFRSAMGACTFRHYASPVSSSQLIYIARMDGTLYATSPTYGLLEWSIYLGDEARAGQRYPDELKTKPRDCEWSYEGVSGLYATPALGPDGSLYLGAGDGWFYKIDDTFIPPLEVERSAP